MNTPCTADHTAPGRPGEIVRLVMAGMTRSGFGVQPSEHPWNDRITIDWPGTRCTLSASDQGCAELVYQPGSGPDPDLTADLATALLTGGSGPFPRLTRDHRHAGITFNGVVGRELKARGLNVALEVYRDDDYFDTRSEIVATGPGTADDAYVAVTGDGCLTWASEHWSDPESSGWITGPAAVAGAMVEAVTQALYCLRPARRG